MIDTRPISRAAPSASCRVAIGEPVSRAPLPLGGLARSRGVKRLADARALVGALEAGSAAAGVRGALAPAETLRLLSRAARAPLAGRAVLLEPKRGQGVLFGPVGITEGRGAPARVRFAAEAARALRSARLATEDPLIAVLSVGREEDARRAAHVARSLAEGARVVKHLEGQGLDAFHAGAQVEDVLADADVVVAPDGASGNLAFRALHLAAGMRSFGAIVLGAPFPFVDTSRRRSSYEDPLRFAAFLARHGRRQ